MSDYTIPLFMHGLAGIFIPVMAIIAGVSLVIVRIVLDYRRKRDLLQLHHAERMAAIEKGIEIPPLPREFYLERSRRTYTPEEYLIRGLTWTLLGAAFMVAMWQMQQQDIAWLGLVLLAMGIKNLLVYLITRRRVDLPMDQA
jgi:hypothetical protein